MPPGGPGGPGGQEGKGDKEGKNEGNKNKCNGCVCKQLRKLDKNTEVDVFLSGGTVLEDVVFKKLKNNCCAKFKDITTEPGSTLFVDCEFIQAIRIEKD